jgi:hypothetical protein
MPDNRQLEILADLLRTAERNFEAFVKHSATIDDKAQKTSALAGVLVAFGFIKPEGLASLQQAFGPLALVLLHLILAFLVVSVTLCLRAMWLRKVPIGGISVAAHERSGRVILRFGDDIDDDLMRAYRENQLALWKQAIAERFATNMQKTRLVHHAQRVLALAIFVAALTLGLLAFIALQAAIPLHQEHKMPEQQQNHGVKPKAEVKRLRGDLAKARGGRDGEILGIDEDGNVVAIYGEVVRPAKYDAIEELHSEMLLSAQVGMLDRLE